MLTLDAKEVHDAINAVASVVPNTGKGQRPILESAIVQTCCLGTVTITGTDLDTWASATVPAEGATTAGLLPIRIAKKSWPKAGKVTLDIAPGVTMLGIGDVRHKLRTDLPQDFPELQAIGDGADYKAVNGDALSAALAIALTIADPSSYREEYRGVHFGQADGQLVIQATDGHVLFQSAPLGECAPIDIIIPARSAKILAKHSKEQLVSLAWSGTHGYLRAAMFGLELAARKIPVAWPDFSGIIGAPTVAGFSVDVEQLADRVKVVTAVGRDGSFLYVKRSGRMVFRNKEFRVTALTDVGLEADGEWRAVRVDPDLLACSLKRLTGRARVGFSATEKGLAAGSFVLATDAGVFAAMAR